MYEPDAGEQRVQGIAALAGLIVAVVASALIGASSGVEVGFAVFFLSLTGVALFVLLVRFLYRRLRTPEATPPARQQPPTERTARRRNRRRR